MTRCATYIHLKPNTMEPCDLTDAAYEAARRSWLCTGCCRPRPEIEAIDVEVYPEGLRKVKLTFINGCLLPLVHRDVLDCFHEAEIERYLGLGNVYDPEGRRIDAWWTFIAKYRVLVRGTKHATYRRCSDCGRGVYFAMGRKYIFPAPSQEVLIFGTSAGIVLPQWRFEELPVKCWPGVEVERLPVLDEPKDSLGVLD